MCFDLHAELMSDAYFSQPAIDNTDEIMTRHQSNFFKIA